MDKLIKCPDCKYYYAPVCTFHKWLPMTSRKMYCGHAVKGKYQGDVPVISEYDVRRKNERYDGRKTRKTHSNKDVT